jgi:hypothetical protein
MAIFRLAGVARVRRFSLSSFVTWDDLKPERIKDREIQMCLYI